MSNINLSLKFQIELDYTWNVFSTFSIFDYKWKVPWKVMNDISGNKYIL